MPKLNSATRQRPAARREMPQALPMQRRALPVGAVDVEARTVTVTFSTGAAVHRTRWEGWDTRVSFDEILVVSREAVNLERLNSGAPVLDSHSAYSLSTQIGVVERAWIEGRGKTAEARAELRFPTEGRDESADRVFAMIVEGIIRNVSVGYILDQIRIVEANEKKGTVEQHLVERWTPYEISFVTVGADAKAQVRTPDESAMYPVAFASHRARALETMGNDIMPKRTGRAAGGNGNTAAATIEDEDDVNRRGQVDDDDGGEGEDEEEQTRAPARRQAQQTRQVQTRAPVIDEEAVRIAAKEAVATERTRSTEIVQAARDFGLTEADAARFVADGSTIHAARAAFQATLAERNKTTAPRGSGVGVRGGADERETRVRLYSNALAHRLMGSTVTLEDGARQYRGLRLIDMARECLIEEGISVRGLTPMEIATLATQPGGSMLAERAGLHSTSDFPIVLGNQVNRTLRESYEAAPTTFGQIARRSTATDFRPIIRAAIGDAPALLKVGEHGEFKYGSVGEGSESYRLLTYGRILGLTRQAMINDDLGAFDRIPRTWGNAAANLQNEIVWAIVTGNPNMADGFPLFSAQHGNLAANPSTINAESIADARQAMRQQRGIAPKAGSASDGEIQRITPPNGRILAVPGALELLVLRFLSPLIVPGTEDAVNPYRAMVEPLIEPLLDDANPLTWYLFGDPSTGFAAIEYAFLDGQEGVYTEQRIGFEIDGIEFKVRLDFGAGAMESRGTYKNVGETASASS